MIVEIKAGHQVLVEDGAYEVDFVIGEEGLREALQRPASLVLIETPTAAFLMFCLIKIFKLDFSSASGNTKILNLSSNFASLVVFAFLGKLNWVYGLSIAVVTTFGAIIGTRLAILKGNKFIKPIFLVVTSIFNKMLESKKQ